MDLRNKSSEHLLGLVLILVVVLGVEERVVVLRVDRSFRSHSSVLLDHPGFWDYYIPEEKKYI